VFTDNETYPTRCYDAMVRPLQGPTILERQGGHHVYRKLHEFAFGASRSANAWEREAGACHPDERKFADRNVFRVDRPKRPRADCIHPRCAFIPARVRRWPARRAGYRSTESSTECRKSRSPRSIMIRPGRGGTPIG
jgi:hypothetical protein